jgi:NADPH-dependent 2,4-dienoyl-CoA reductase/sulfur reductase-like enzyme
VPDALWQAGITPENGRVDGVDPDAGRVHLLDGRQLPYEHFVIATGATGRPGAIVGLPEHSVCIRDLGHALALKHVRGQAREGAEPRVLFALPPRAQSSVPLYEVALMLDTWLPRARA